MKKKFASILLTLIGLLGLSAAAKATIRDEIVVTLPFEFVVSGKTLPAGIYTLSRFSDDRLDGLLLTSYKNHVSILVYPSNVGSALVDSPELSFQRVAGERFLTRIQTA